MRAHTFTGRLWVGALLRWLARWQPSIAHHNAHPEHYQHVWFGASPFKYWYETAPSNFDFKLERQAQPAGG